MTDFLAAAAAIWHLLAVGAIVTVGCLWADRDSDRQWRAELHARDVALGNDLERLHENLAERVDARYRSHAACRRGQDTPAQIPGWERELLLRQRTTDLPFNVTEFRGRRRS